ncbi:CREB/ATF bZIP transcription factor isoform X2 [Dunckerocampus dactyliophorus]|uniref:CREB/ATF bZIP transcription factor isoform X2 n=1 Tax=Dunckerocampus dactyliophorus TaxID=161453 RepID=UPI002405A530|nr:CREB/ATF bZIP transcription factor isoform X2 [Dunckerocampus dactyliophorus]
MITRRRGHRNTELKSLEVEVSSAVKTIEDFPDLPEEFPVDDFDSAGIELDDLFGIEGLKWTLERDTTSPLFDIELGEYNAKNQDSGAEVSTASSPESVSSALKIRNKQQQSLSMINKNAIAARLNRLKKKEYVNSLEKKVGMMSTENNMLKVENSQLTKRVEELEDETRYLRAVLANESMLAQLLSRLSGVNGMKLSSSLFQGADSNEHDYALPRKRVKVEEKETSGGVCLHVDKNHVSVEFCTKCAESASTSVKM